MWSLVVNRVSDMFSCSQSKIDGDGESYWEANAIFHLYV